MESALTNLVLGKSAFGATPMGGSVKKIRDLLINTMMPAVVAAHNADQKGINALGDALAKCGKLKNDGFEAAKLVYKDFKNWAKEHQSCRKGEAIKLSSKISCNEEEKAEKVNKELQCKAFAFQSRKWGTQKANVAVMKKAGAESTISYITRISSTFCGKHVHGTKGQKKLPTEGWGGGLRSGALDIYLRHRARCAKAKDKKSGKEQECQRKRDEYKEKKEKCDQFQDLMDSAACKGAIMMKDTCERYTECYYDTLRALGKALGAAKQNEIDRKAEWRGLKRMSCLMGAFADGKVTGKEVSACKSVKVNTNLFKIKPAPIAKLPQCSPPGGDWVYPATAEYKKIQFAPLPVLAKGKEPKECSGIQEVSLKPINKSPKSCKCFRTVLSGFYSAGPVVLCSNCLDVRRSKDKNSCPAGTKLFSPSTKSDWKTLLKSAGPVRDPNWIVDVTRPQNGCGGCTGNAMNSGNANQKSWQTSDGSPWWLRSTKYSEPNGDYKANCFLNLNVANNDVNVKGDINKITFNDHKCAYHSKSYYCQAVKLDLTPKKGSPRSCKCSKVELSGRYAAGTLVKCEQCLTVYKSTQKNSCPGGFKIFAPQSRRDWKTFLTSATPLRAPHFIIDVTRPQNGCGGCTKYPMRSVQPHQATWRTSDGSPWWLRSTRYTEPNGDYTANCFMDLWHKPASEDKITFNDGNCNYHSRSYYCQEAKKK